MRNRSAIHKGHIAFIIRRCVWDASQSRPLGRQRWRSLEFWADSFWLLRFSLPGSSLLMPRLVLLCDLERFTNGYRISGPFVSELWLSFEISTTLIAFLDTLFTSAFAPQLCGPAGGQDGNWFGSHWKEITYQFRELGCSNSASTTLFIPGSDSRDFVLEFQQFRWPLRLKHTVEKGEKRSCSALFEHIQFCERSMKRSALKYPWQLGFMGRSGPVSISERTTGYGPSFACCCFQFRCCRSSFMKSWRVHLTIIAGDFTASCLRWEWECPSWFTTQCCHGQVA